MLVTLYEGDEMYGIVGRERGELLEHGMKELGRMFEKRLRAVVGIVDDMQCGFMPGKEQCWLHCSW